MPTGRLTMRRIRDVLRFAQGLSDLLSCSRTASGWAESPCSYVSRSIVRMSCTVLPLACLRLGMVLIGLVQEGQNVAAAQLMTNRAHVSPELSGN